MVLPRTRRKAKKSRSGADLKNTIRLAGLVRVTISATIPMAAILALSLPGQAKSAHHKPCKEPVSLTQEHNNGNTWVKARVLVKAPPEVVWYSVHEERKHDPDLAYSKIIEEHADKNECTLEQKFVLIPVIGSSVCLMNNTEVPLQRIDYKLIKSDRFKAMEGSWVLTPCEDGKATLLELSSHLDLGLPVPKSFMNSVASKKLERRLSHVKTMAEGMHSRVAAKGNVVQ